MIYMDIIELERTSGLVVFHHVRFQTWSRSSRGLFSQIY
ncbi:hypothetical protein ISN44_As04g035910 [Arabidopsis suecica]|uniref:Uncharacterized protein n=1 Tax=Arabidopsis suecica TaxID=45249 RepID=A0A8T2EHH5_ARASU|nr:hypothetical protein ISN44_As04g035910 [Arabidopsis suecica]